MKQKLRLMMTMLLLAVMGSAWAQSTITDVLNQQLTGVTGTSYSSWSGKTSSSDAVYAGQSAGGNSSIQLRSSNSNSGVITTASGGKVTEIVVSWNTNTASGRTLNVYGKNTPYVDATDLYDSSKQGTLIGTIVNGTSTTLTVDGDYEYIGLRSASGAMYLSEIKITWSTSNVATPTFSLISGTYSEVQTVTITNIVEGANVYYTVDGSTPTENSTPYTSPITVGKSMTLKAIAVKDGNSSAVVSADYILKVSKPEFSLTEGTYRGEQSVSISCATPGAVIYYTTDGTEPTTNSTQYTSAISVAETTTIKAIATYGEMDNSDVASATYTIKEPLSGDVFVKATSLSDLEDGMEVIIVNDTYDNVMAGVGASGNNFAVSTITIDKSANPYEAELDNESTSIFILEGSVNGWYFKDENGEYLYAASSSSNHLKTQEEQNDNAKATISFSGENSDAVIKFQGSYTRNIIRYNGTKNGDGIFSCYASGQKPVQIYYRSQQSTLAKPTITPASDTYTEAQTVTITNNAEGSTVYYTIDGTTPTNESTKYTKPFEIGKNGTYVVKAISIGADRSSRVTTNTIIIDITVDAPVFTETSGSTFTEPYTIHLTAAQGTSIYYTTGTASPLDENGNLSGNAKVYNATTGIANLTNAMTINAVAIDKWGNVSEITTAKYKYVGEVVLPYYENFDEDLGNFVTESEGKVKWEFQTNHDVATYGEERKYAYISGGTYNTMSSNVGEDRLISPVLDLTNYETVTMNFVHAGHWFGSSSTGVDTYDSETVKKASCHLQVRKVGDTEWTDISIPNWFVQKRENTKNMYERINSGDIDLSSYKGQKIQVCFYFTSTSETSGTWNVLKFAVTGTQEEEEVNYETVNMKTDGYITYVVKNDIDWDATMKMNAGVYGYKVIQFTEAAKGGNGTTVLVELGNNVEMAVDEKKTETSLTDDQRKPLWSEKITPAGTPIILKGHAGDNLLVIAKSDDVIPSVKGNLLKPSFGDVQGSSAQTLYVLQKTSDWVDTDPYNNYLFYKLANGRQIPDRKAYLNGADASEEIIYYLANKPDAQGPGDPVSPHAKQNFIILSHTESEQLVSEDAGIPDGIEAVSGNNETKDRVFYSISGVKVSNPTKGIYILNGKKVIVK